MLHSFKRLALNSTRLTTQFIDCEGLPLPMQNTCLKLKGNVFRSIFTSPNFNLESNLFMLEPNCGSTCFDYSQKYLLTKIRPGSEFLVGYSSFRHS